MPGSVGWEAAGTSDRGRHILAAVKEDVDASETAERVLACPEGPIGSGPGRHGGNQGSLHHGADRFRTIIGGCLRDRPFLP